MCWFVEDSVNESMWEAFSGHSKYSIYDRESEKKDEESMYDRERKRSGGMSRRTFCKTPCRRISV